MQVQKGSRHWNTHPANDYRIGVLVLQGSFAEHIDALQLLGISAVHVHRPEQLEALQGLIIPGGESTALIHLMNRSGLIEAIFAATQRGMAVYGSCAGLILLGRPSFDARNASLNLLDIEVSRNCYGRQINSFEIDLDVSCLGSAPFRAIFIRAPAIRSVGENVEVLARLPNGVPVAVRSTRHLATAFHPELTGDPRFHQLFVDMVCSAECHIPARASTVNISSNQSDRPGIKC